MDAARFAREGGGVGGGELSGSISYARLDHKSSQFLKEYPLYVYLFHFFNATSCCMLNSFVLPFPVPSLASSC